MIELLALNPGQRIGPFEVLSLLGRGGMGEVFLATDMRLDRKVAIKVLPAEFASDRQRLCRFEQEAKTLASLDHPNIVSIFEVGTHGAAPYLVSQFLEGNTLRAELEDGALPQRKAIDYALQIANGLAAAHGKGVVHRDLKPENVFVTRDGRVKILDFGLAKLKSKALNAQRSTFAARPTEAETLVQTTEPGIVLGTVGYMSPEQVRGEEADQRSDIFSFGCILFEMLTGQRAFRKETSVQTMSAILTEEILEPSRLNPNLSPGLDRIVHRCLEKHPERRFQTASDLAFALEGLSGSTMSVSQEAANSIAALPPTVRRARLERWAWMTTSCLLLSALAVQLWWPRKTSGIQESTAPALQRFSIGLATNTLLAFGDWNTGFESPLIAISPDASEIAYIARTPTGTQLCRRRLQGWESRPVPNTQGAIHPFYSPDGLWLGFLTSDKIKKVSLVDESVEEVCTARTPIRAAWADDNWIYASISEGQQLARIKATGGELELLAVGRLGQILPDGSAAFTTTSKGGRYDYGEIALLDLQTKESKNLDLKGYDAHYVRSGHLIFCREAALYAVPFDLKERTVLSDPVQIEFGVAMQSLFALGQFGVARDGTLIYVPGHDLALGRIASVDREGNSEFIRDMPEKIYNVFDLSPDNQRLAVEVADGDDDIWVYDLASGFGRKVTTEPASIWPQWRPPGADTISFSSRAGGTPRLLVQRVDGHDEPVEIMALRTPGWLAGCGWAPDGKKLTVNMAERDMSIQVGWFDLERRELHTVSTGYFGTFSPDGQWMAYSSERTGQYEVWVSCLTDPEGKRRAQQISSGGGMEPIWLPSGELIWRWQRRWFTTRITTAPDLRFEPQRVAFETEFSDTRGLSYDVSSDGQRLYVVKRTRPPLADEIRVVRNWQTSLTTGSRSN